MQYIIGVAGLALIFGMAFIVSNDRKKIKYRPIITMLVLQFVLGFLLLNTSAGNVLISTIANGFTALLNCAREGINFVFGRLANPDDPIFFMSVLMPITFISTLIGILQHWHILPFIIKYIGLALSKVNGMGKLESYNAVASAILGQSEVFISVKKLLGPLPPNRLYTLCASAMSTVSMSIVGAYMVMIEPKYVVTALVLNLFGGFIIASIINPYEVKPEDDILVVAETKRQSFFEMLGEYILDGFKVGVIVCAMLIGFVGIITLINNVFLGIIGICALLKELKLGENVLNKDMPFLLIVSLLVVGFILLSWDLTRIEGIVLLILIIGYTAHLVYTSKKSKGADFVEKPKFGIGRSIVYVVVGLAAIILGAQLVVNSSSYIAMACGMSETLVGLTIVAIGTSLPELVTSLTALKRDENQLVIGNVIGSNIFNILFVLGLSSTITPIPVNSNMIVDLGLMIIVTILCLIFGKTQSKFDRKEGIILLGLFILYMAFVIFRN